MECNLIWNHTRDFKIERARSANSIWNHKYDFRLKLHDPKFNYHFIRSILKTHNFMASNFRFWCNVPSWAGFSFKHNKQTSMYENSLFHGPFMHKSSILVAWINDGRPSFLLWLRPRLFSLSLEKEFEGAAGAILQWISFELWNSLDCTMPSSGEFSLLNTVQWHSAWF